MDPITPSRDINKGVDERNPKRVPQLNMCPFCGSTLLWISEVPSSNGVHYYVTCTECDAEGPSGKSKETATSKWNGRSN